jgi:sRNA-binding carbon storage regulator CsrA
MKRGMRNWTLGGTAALASVVLAAGMGLVRQPEAPSRSQPAPDAETDDRMKQALEAQEAARAKLEAERAAQAAAIRGPLIDVKFDGGTMAKFIEIVQSIANPRPNIVADPDVAALNVSTLVLKQVSVRDALTAAITAADVSSNAVRLAVEAPHEVNPMYRVVVSSRLSTVYREARPRSAFQAFPVTEWAGPPEVTLSAIETALSIRDEGEKPKVSFHKEAGLIFVSGNEFHVQTVKEVLDGLVARAHSQTSLENQKAMRVLASQMFAGLDSEQIVQQIKEWERKAKRADEESAGFDRAQAEFELRKEVLKRELEDVRKRADQVPFEMQKQIEQLHIQIAQQTASQSTLIQENRQLRMELEALKVQKSGGK